MDGLMDSDYSDLVADFHDWMNDIHAYNTEEKAWCGKDNVRMSDHIEIVNCEECCERYAQVATPRH